MDKFTKACRLACEQWVDSLPQDAPTHHFSPAFEEAVRPLLQPNITAVPKKKRKFTKKTLKILVAAAVLLALAVATTAIAVPLARRANVTQLPGCGNGCKKNWCMCTNFKVVFVHFAKFHFFLKLLSQNA